MNDPTSIVVDLGDLLDRLERLYMSQHARGFANPKPKLIDPNDPKAENIPAGFLQWWKENRNCDINPLVAWKAQHFRDQYYDEVSRSRPVRPF